MKATNKWIKIISWLIPTFSILVLIATLYGVISKNFIPGIVLSGIVLVLILIFQPLVLWFSKEPCYATPIRGDVKPVSIPPRPYYRLKSEGISLSEYLGEIDENMYRPSSNIDDFMERLKLLWKKNPELRFGQLISNLTESGEKDIFYLEDSDLKIKIEKEIKKEN